MFIARRRLKPTVAALVALATADGDFYRDITPHADPARIAADHATRAAESWEDAEDVLPGFVAGDVIADARTVLAALAKTASWPTPNRSRPTPAPTPSPPATWTAPATPSPTPAIGAPEP